MRTLEKQQNKNLQKKKSKQTTFLPEHSFAAKEYSFQNKTLVCETIQQTVSCLIVPCVEDLFSKAEQIVRLCVRVCDQVVFKNIISHGGNSVVPPREVSA
jgi:hypothetical protein